MRTKKQLEAENFILWATTIIFFLFSLTAAIGYAHYKLEPQLEPQEECMDEYWENEYRTIKRLYDLDEAYLWHGKKVDDTTWSVPVEYVSEF